MPKSTILTRYGRPNKPLEFCCSAAEFANKKIWVYNKPEDKPLLDLCAQIFLSIVYLSISNLQFCKYGDHSFGFYHRMIKLSSRELYICWGMPDTVIKLPYFQHDRKSQRNYRI